MPDAPFLSRWAEGELTAALFAIDPTGLGGIIVRGQPGPVRDAWMRMLGALLPGMKPRRLPLQIADERLLGGLDLAASLAAARPVSDTGLLAEADGRLVLIPMAERLSPMLAGRLVSVLDTGEVALERDGLTLRTPTRFGVVAFDEGLAEEQRPHAALADRLAFAIDLDGVSLRETDERNVSADDISAARERVAGVTNRDAMIGALSAAALGLGIASLRAPLFALRTSRAAAALFARTTVTDDDASLAARLTLAHRATRLPTVEDSEPEPQQAENSEADAPDLESAGDRTGTLEDVVLAAAAAAIPTGLLASLGASRTRSRGDAFGRSAGSVLTLKRGRPAGILRARSSGGARLNIIETLRAAAPWQTLRRREHGAADPQARRVEVRRDDFRVTRFKQQTETTTIFVVDASGSSAFHRLAEVKGAVELLLAESYVRRDRVALIAFRGDSAELLLPPTRSLTRAKRDLAGLPGGGRTPLASGIDAAIALADAVKRGGRMPAIVLMTDARANTTRDGTTDRVRADAEALSAARMLRARGTVAILVDTSPRARPEAAHLAEAMGARYVALPYAASAALSTAVKASVEEARRTAPH